MTTFAETLAKVGTHRPRVLRNLKVSEVSSVDEGAGRGVKVILVKRGDASTITSTQEVEMAKANVRCPNCGHEASAENFAKVAAAAAPESPEIIAKAVHTVHKSIAAKLQAENPGMSLATAMAKACETAEMSEMHRQEKLMRLGAGY